MLTELHIKNVALIAEAEISLDSGLNVLSGETGAGKSIIVDSLMLLLGAKYDKTLLRYGESNGFVEGVFTLDDRQRELFPDFADEELLIVRRRFDCDGKSEIKVNGKTYTTSMLKNLMSNFVDIYGQNEYYSLNRLPEHLRILDGYARQSVSGLLSEIGEEYRRYRSAKLKMKELGNLSEREKNMDLYRYQIAEIESAKIGEHEEEEIALKRKLFMSAEKIAAALSSAANALGGKDENASALVDTALGELNSVAAMKPVYGELSARLDSLSIELNDIYDAVLGELDFLDFDEREIDRVEKRYDLILLLKRKYGNFAKMTAYAKEARANLDRLENCAEEYARLEKESAAAAEKLDRLSRELSRVRKEKAIELEKAVTAELSELGMEHSEFKIVFGEEPVEAEERFSEKGFDRPEFYLSPNIGQPLKPLIKIISGGELSRFMLALKVISSKSEELDTLIFDEIDTGISGKIGQAVSRKLARISRGHQVLCVTHLSQIAAMADKHFYIEKYVEGEDTFTAVKALDENGIIEEISRLSGGKDISARAEQNAAEMKKWCSSYKSTLTS